MIGASYMPSESLLGRVGVPLWGIWSDESGQDISRNTSERQDRYSPVSTRGILLATVLVSVALVWLFRNRDALEAAEELDELV